MAARPLVLTIRVPFCARRCSFCGEDVHVPPAPVPAARRGRRGRGQAAGAVGAADGAGGMRGVAGSGAAGGAAGGASVPGAQGAAGAAGSGAGGVCGAAGGAAGGAGAQGAQGCPAAAAPASIPCTGPLASGMPGAEHLGELTLRGPYLEAVAREFQSMAADLQGHELRALRVTGGTPTLCDADQIARLVRAVRSGMPCADDLEVSLQTLPGTLGVDALSSLRKVGFTRFELGLGAFNLFSWSTLGRPVSLEAASVTANVLRCANVKGWGVRLFSGLPGQTARTMADDVEAALALGASHVRLEALPLAAGTPFWRHFVEKTPVLDLPRHDLVLPSAEEAAALQAAGERALEKHGLLPYAPGCFALPGHELRFEKELAGGGADMQPRSTQDSLPSESFRQPVPGTDQPKRVLGDVFGGAACSSVKPTGACDRVELGCGGVSVVDGLRTVNTRDLERYILHAADPSQVVETVEDLTLGR